MQLDDTWGDLLQQYQMMLYESIGYYGNAVKELEDLGGVSITTLSMKLNL